MKRYCEKFILKDIENKMVFIGGPRQVGKTTLSKQCWEGQYTKTQYFNWDIDEDRRAILKKHWRRDSDLLIFDELHKYPKWKQWIKGVYDGKPDDQHYLVTGSARLDTYRKGGDSLLGRYHYWRLHPFTLDEKLPNIDPLDAYERLLHLGGFPEPFLSHDRRGARRWRRDRFARVLREDIRDLQLVHHTQLLYLLVDSLRTRVGSMISLSNLAEDLQVAFKTVQAWLQVIADMYIAFPIYPITRNIPRAIQKPVKVYFYDNADVLEDEGGAKRLENLVATHLLKRLHFLEDYHGYQCQLHYLRDKDNREIDFVTVIDGKVHELIEVKSKDTTISSALKYYSNKLKPAHTVQIVGQLRQPFDSDGIRVTDPIHYFVDPPWEVEV